MPLSATIGPERVRAARLRRSMTRADLGAAIGVKESTIADYERSGAPAASVERLSEALAFPAAFFQGDRLPDIDSGEILFQSGRRASKRDRDCAESFAVTSFLITDWIRSNYRTPMPDLPSLNASDPLSAARELRSEWGRETQPIKNMTGAVEARGVHVYSLPPEASSVCSFSTWIEGVPHIFVTRRRSANAMRLDIAHELGHLVMHDRFPEMDPCGAAQLFASEFLVPSSLFEGHIDHAPLCDELIDMAGEFGTIPAVLARDLHRSGHITDALHILLRSQLHQLELAGAVVQSEMEETSTIFSRTFHAKGSDVTDAASSTGLPESEIRIATFGLVVHETATQPTVPSTGQRPNLQVIR